MTHYYCQGQGASADRLLANDSKAYSKDASLIQWELCGTPADTAGQEKGYLVRMTDDTLVPPYPLKPGQNVTIVSKYYADDRHYGE